MVYLLIVPCVALICLTTRSRALPENIFLLVFAGLWGGLYASQWLVPGAEAIVALSITLALVNLFEWAVEDWWSTNITRTNGDSNPIDGNKRSLNRPVNNGFCSRLTHDFAIDHGQNLYAVQMINMEEWDAISKKLSSMSAQQQQGFYASLNYSSISERALLRYAEQHPDCADAHILYGHHQLCKAKRLGMIYGRLPEEGSATAVGESLMAFRRALAIDASNAEAMAGILIAKASMAMSDEQVRSSLATALAADRRHFHSILTAARHLVIDADAANAFVEEVSHYCEGDEASVAFAELVAHVQCMINIPLELTADGSDTLIAQINRAIETLNSQPETMGDWQSAIAENLCAYALQHAGAEAGTLRAFKTVAECPSPYPWQMPERTIVSDSSPTASVPDRLRA